MPGSDPVPGDVYVADTDTYSEPDPKSRRPIAIVRSAFRGRVAVMARTTDVTVPGVLTPAGVVPGLDAPGVFSLRYQHNILISEFSTNRLIFLGSLPEPFKTDVLNLLLDRIMQQAGVQSAGRSRR